MYKPKNSIIVYTENGNIKKIIGAKKDTHVLYGMARIDALQNIKNSDIQKSILNLGTGKRLEDK